MKTKSIFKKIHQFLSYIFPLLGMFAGLALVPFIWGLVLDMGHFYFVIYSLICIPFFVMYYHSFIRLKVTFNEDIHSRFEEELQEESSSREYLSFLFRQKSFWIQFAVTALMFVLVPLRTAAPVAAWIFGAYGNFGKELIALCVFLPFLFVVYTVGHISAINFWQQQREMKRDVSKKEKRNTYISLMAAYAIVPFALLTLWNFVTLYIPLLFELWKRHSSPLLLVLVVFVLLFVVSFGFLRVLFTRKKCIKHIKKVCQEMGFEITNIKHPYLSAFRVCKGESFQLRMRGKTYSCKLVGATKRGVPLVIHPLGGLHFMYSFRLFKTPIFTHTTVKHFGYESEHSKILIINPVPKELFCHFGNKIEEIDNGAKVGDYKIYTATAFVRAIETDTVERLR